MARAWPGRPQAGTSISAFFFFALRRAGSMIRHPSNDTAAKTGSRQPQQKVSPNSSDVGPAAHIAVRTHSQSETTQSSPQLQAASHPAARDTNRTSASRDSLDPADEPSTLIFHKCATVHRRDVVLLDPREKPTAVHFAQAPLKSNPKLRLELEACLIWITSARRCDLRARASGSNTGGIGRH